MHLLLDPGLALLLLLLEAPGVSGSVGRCSGCDGAGHGRGRWAGVALSPEGSKRLGAGHAGVGARRARLRELLTALRDREPVAARGAVHLLS